MMTSNTYWREPASLTGEHLTMGPFPFDNARGSIGDAIVSSITDPERPALEKHPHDHLPVGGRRNG